MFKKLLYIFVILFSITSFAQNESNDFLLRGKVLYQNSNVPNENVINITSETITTTNDDGEFEIYVNIGDQLVLSSVTYELATVTITQKIIDNGRLVVEVNEKVTELDEIVVGPQNPQKFVDARAEEFSQVEYEKDAATEFKNPVLAREQGLQNGLNFVNLAKLLFRSKKDEAEENDLPKPKLSEVLLQVYNLEFFVIDLKLPKEEVQNFLSYLDTKDYERTLLKKENEFQFIDFLVNQSKAYKEYLQDKKE